MAGLGVQFKLPDLKAFAEDEAKKAANLIRDAALETERQAKLLAPVDTGRLRSSIASNITPREATVGTNVDYASYQEYGTIHQAGKPFLRPAFYDVIARLQSFFK